MRSAVDMRRMGAAGILVAVFAIMAAGLAAAKGGSMSFESLDKVKKRLKPGMYAVIDTSMGRIICELYPKIAPLGVNNFAGLAEGTKEWTDPKTGKKVKTRFYDGLIFHRIIPDFMVQGGDPMGTGMGGPGYRFKNEVDAKVGFDKPGRLAYANAGPDTNGSQFFITHKATPWLNGGYTIFGQAIEGQSVVNAMGAVKRDPNDRPLEEVKIVKVTILRIADKKGGKPAGKKK